MASRTGEPRTARSRRTRRALVDAVREDLRANGAFTAETVAELAGCSAATFYSHFGNKDDALTAAFEQTLVDLVQGSDTRLTEERFLVEGIGPVVAEFVDWLADFFRVESLVFRTALGRLPHHRPLRDVYRQAEIDTLARREATFRHLQDRSLVRAGDPGLLAETFMVASQGINNPRALRPEAAGVRGSLAEALTTIISPRGEEDS